MLAEVIAGKPEMVLGHVAIAMSLARIHEEIETFIGLNQSIGKPDGVSWMNVIVYFASSNK